MTNPFDPNYLATPSAQFGVLAWIFFALQIAGALAGLYIWYIRTDSNPVRKALWRQLGIGLAIIGGVGVIVGLLRLGDVPFFNRRFWFYLLLLVELALGAYVLYFARTSYPTLVAQATRSRTTTSRGPVTQQRSMAAKSSAANTPLGVPEPPARTSTNASTRREARRDRKRRNK